jgi:N-methylhydantoinase B
MNSSAAAADPMTVEIVRHRLDSIANEMEATLIRSSFSPVVKESMDASSSIFSPDGVSLAQAAAIPIHLVTLVPCVAAIIETFPVDTMAEDDIYVLNDPYCGGTHLPDFAVVMPVIWEGAVIALSCTMTHHQDVGGMAPGSVPTNATEIFQEGIRVPPTCLRRSDTWNDTLLNILKLNVRIPDMFIGDLHAQIAGCSTGVKRLKEMAEIHGVEALGALFVSILDRSEQLTRASLRNLPAGTYNYVDYLDNDGVVLDKRVRIEVTTTVAADGSLTIDFTGTDPQTVGPVNCVPSGTLAAAFYAVRALTDPSIPTNGGCLRPVTLIRPKGSLVNPESPAPVNTRTVTIKLAAACIVGSLREALPDRIPASDAVDMHGIAWGGRRSDGSRYIISEMIAGGSGAALGRDGVDVIETDGTNCMNLPVEVLESDAPIRMLRFQLREDSGGAGRHRGGLGVIREYEILDGDLTVTHRGERFYSRPRGAAGGHDGASSISRILRRDGSVEVIPSKQVFRMEAGDRLTIETAGGGGYGPPHQRDPAEVERDVLDAKVSPEAAADLYDVGSA